MPPLQKSPKWADDLRIIRASHRSLAFPLPDACGQDFTPLSTASTVYTRRVLTTSPQPPAQGRHRRHLSRNKQTGTRRPRPRGRYRDRTPRPGRSRRPTSPGPELLTRLEDLLFTCGVLPSVQRGLLGDLQALVLCGDGAALPTGASPHGRPTCDCRAHGIFRCDHDRFYRCLGLLLESMQPA
jgi:hypothetical protein